MEQGQFGVQFNLLGTIEVRDGESLLALGGAKQRALLALLVLHANEPVSRDRLVDALWGESPGPGAEHRLETQISRLRKALEPDGRLVSGRGAYTLEIDPMLIDAYRFERLVEDGRRKAAAGRAGAAARTLREALSLWRGGALADLAYASFARPEIERLEELRVSALEDWGDAELEQGDGCALVGELEALVREHPYRERLRGLLMLALYRSGRQTDALATYRDVCRALREELGLQPSERLRELERAILSHDPSLMGSKAPAPTHHLPVPATPFLGRVRELAEVTALIWGSGKRLITLTGAGGSGKTRLAIRAAQACAEDYSGGAAFVGFADLTDPELITPAICQALEVAERPELTPAQQLEEYLRGRELLLVLDNLEQLVSGVGVLGEVLAACPGVKMLATSREPLRLAGEQQYEVPVLDAVDAIELFIARARAVAPNLIIERDRVGEVCEQLDRLPLAIELAAARTKVLSPAEILDRLEHRLPVLGSGPRDAPQRQHTLQATIDWSYELLSDEEQRLFTRLAVFAGGCTFESAEAVCDAALDTLEGLVDRSLIRSDGGRYWMLQTLREYALEELARSGDKRDTRRRHAQWFVAFMEQAVERMRTADQSVWRTLWDETDNLRAALAWLLEHDIPRGVELASALFEPWAMHGQSHELIVWCERALATLTTVDVQTRAVALKTYGEALDVAERHESARHAFQESLRLFRQVGDRRAEADVLAELALAAFQAGWDQDASGSDEEAIGLSEAALAISRELQYAAGIQRALQIMGACRRDDPTQAAAMLDQALAIARERGDTNNAASIMHSLGDLALDRDDPSPATHHYRDALKIATDLGDERNAAYCIAGLACGAALRGDIFAAGRLWAAAEAIEDRLGRRMEPTSRKRYERILSPLSENEQFRDAQQASSEPRLEEAVLRLALG